MQNSDDLLRQALGCCQEADVVVVEGFKSSNLLKVMVHGGADPIDMPGDVVTHISNTPVESTAAPVFSNTPQGISELAAFILERKAETTQPAASLTVDGVEVELGSFPERALQGVVEGFLASLKGVPDGGNWLVVEIRRDRSIVH